MGLSPHALQPSPSAGRRVTPATLTFDGWFIQSGQRVFDPNFPLVGELRSQHHRLKYTARKDATDRSTVGRRVRGIPASGGGVQIAGRPLHSEERGEISFQTGINPPCRNVGRARAPTVGRPSLAAGRNGGKIPIPLEARERLGYHPWKGKISREGQTFPGNSPLPGNTPGNVPGSIPGRLIAAGG